jgi:hypothetical protein
MRKGKSRSRQPAKAFFRRVKKTHEEQKAAGLMAVTEKRRMIDDD